ncbi:asparagine synthase (glutamine-hydrolysing) [Chitinophaga costaii]|uniref:asparagine synthase (glutamine-hydrolyzing) n=1 Tax=Chitinophaga costaii TaxID=1335309 RepID=A0A1C3ZX79_9BACT|nr:asparagine synthase (glutamine-hydrolyzing) [Chitinophaga costaii]PUZ30537.1 asparagine synthase (glutamine-hydrolyzing) [Chitinophaga costaii]SCB86830.1 asparagine synthase (glutamine-hydrolysing) [Chitinophaga costaii]
MCGIGGILLAKDMEPVLQQKMKALNEAQRHRGPDDQQTWVKGPAALCHQRLSLLDAAGGTQPFADTSGRYLIVYNGELYNHVQLREMLRPHYDFRTHCDTEVVLAAWITWGAACLERFNGMFAFLIWDSQQQTAFAARDPLGVKPFVYYQHNGTFYFASEVKALLRVLDRQPQIDPQRLVECVISPATSGNGAASVFKNIQYLEPGTTLHFNKDGLSLKTYYQFLWKQTSLHENTLLAELAAALQQNVALSMQADVPVGVFLSGGLDSSLLATLAAPHTASPLQTFTIAFPHHQHIHFDPGTIVNSDDLPFAKAIAAQTGSRFNEVTMQHTSVAESLQLLVSINDRIPVWEQELSQQHLSRAAAQQLKAVLVGDAADETHYGYYFLLHDKVNKSPRGLMDLFGAERRATMLSANLLRQLEPLAWLDQEYRQLVSQAGYTFGKSAEENILAMSLLVNRRWLGRLLHNGDIHTMHYGLEARVPFANPHLLNTVMKVPPALGFKEGVEKYMLRQVALQHMPPSLALRKKSSLPRDPRLGKTYQAILQKLLQTPNDFIDTYLHRPALAALCQQEVIPESDRMLLFNMICLIYWGLHYAN